MDSTTIKKCCILFIKEIDVKDSPQEYEINGMSPEKLLSTIQLNYFKYIMSDKHLVKYDNIKEGYQFILSLFRGEQLCKDDVEEMYDEIKNIKDLLNELKADIKQSNNSSANKKKYPKKAHTISKKIPQKSLFSPINLPNTIPITNNYYNYPPGGNNENIELEFDCDDEDELLELEDDDHKEIKEDNTNKEVEDEDIEEEVNDEEDNDTEEVKEEDSDTEKVEEEESNIITGLLSELD